MKKGMIAATMTAFAVALPGSALAMPATATVDLNVRSGPGPQYEIIGAIGANDSVEVTGCLPSSFWCQVNAGAGNGWAYGKYLTASVSGDQVVIVDSRDRLEVPQAEFEVSGGTAAGAATGAVAGAIIGGPVGAAIGGVAGAAAGTIADPPDRVRAYVVENRYDPVLLEGEVVVGAQVPETVELRTIPDYEYRYVYLNQQPVLVDPGSRQIVYVYR